MGEKENSPKWIGWMEAWWMSFSFRLSIYHSWFPGDYGWIRWPWRTPWHWSKHVKFRPSWLFHKGCLSLHSCQIAMLSHVGNLNSANSASSNDHSAFIWARGSVVPSSSFIWKLPLGWPWANLGCCLCNHRKTLTSSVYLFLFPWEGFPRQTCKTHLRRNKDLNLWIKFRLYIDCITIPLRQPW